MMHEVNASNKQHVSREGKVRVQIKFPATDAILLRTFDETDLLSTVVDYVKEVSTSD